MRAIFGISLFLVGLGMFTCQLEGSTPTHRSSMQTTWVRTVDGWERVGTWMPTVSHGPRLHPLVVASSQVLISVFALAAATSCGGKAQ